MDPQLEFHPPLIVFEGIAGSGKTTQARLLAEELSIQGNRVCLNREPTDGPFGSLIRDIVSQNATCLRKGINPLELNSKMGLTQEQCQRVFRLYAPVHDMLKFAGKNSLTELDRQILFMLDRLWNISCVLEQARENGFTVVQDRYNLSTLVHGLANGVSGLEISELETEIYGEEYIAPDITIIIDVDPEEARRRLDERGDISIYDSLERMQELRRLYLEVDSNLQSSAASTIWPPVSVVIDGNRSLQEVAKDVLEAAEIVR